MLEPEVRHPDQDLAGLEIDYDDVDRVLHERRISPALNGDPPAADLIADDFAKLLSHVQNVDRLAGGQLDHLQQRHRAAPLVADEGEDRIVFENSSQTEAELWVTILAGLERSSPQDLIPRVPLQNSLGRTGVPRQEISVGGFSQKGNYLNFRVRFLNGGENGFSTRCPQEVKILKEQQLKHSINGSQEDSETIRVSSAPGAGDHFHNTSFFVT